MRTNAELRKDQENAKSFFKKVLRGKVDPRERDKVLAAGREHRERYQAASAELPSPLSSVPRSRVGRR